MEAGRARVTCSPAIVDPYLHKQSSRGRAVGEHGAKLRARGRHGNAREHSLLFETMVTGQHYDAANTRHVMHPACSRTLQ